MTSKILSLAWLDKVAQDLLVFAETFDTTQPASALSYIAANGLPSLKRHAPPETCDIFLRYLAVHVLEPHFAELNDYIYEMLQVSGFEPDETRCYRVIKQHILNLTKSLTQRQLRNMSFVFDCRVVL